MERGVITNASSIKLNMTGFGMGPSLTPELVRYYLLYWDKLIVPDNSLIRFTIPDEEDLISVGKLIRPRSKLTGNYFGNEIGDAIIRAQSDVATFFQKDTTTDWSLHQHGSNQFYFPDTKLELRETLRYRLTNVLPVPDKSVHINDILEFKESRSDELGELHQYLDSLYLEILKSPDPSISANKSIVDLQKSLNNLDKVSKERFKLRNYVDFECSYNQSVKDIAAIAAIGFSATKFDLITGFSVPIGTVTGALLGLASGLSVSIKPRAVPLKPTSNMTYLEKASKAGVVKV